MFEVDDVESEWQYSRPFDYVHSRYMAGSIADWPRLMSQCYKLSLGLFICFRIRPASRSRHPIAALLQKNQTYEVDFYSTVI